MGWKLYKKYNLISAVQLKANFKLHCGNASKGDYLCEDANGRQWIEEKEKFESYYKEV